MMGFVDDLDTTIRRIRAAIFRLHSPDPEAPGAQQPVLRLLVDENRGGDFPGSLCAFS